MASRIPRLWQPGNPKMRVFLPDFWLRPVEVPKVGASHLPSNMGKFEIDPRMSAHDVREYLEKIYKLPVREVKTQNVMGEITYDLPKDKTNQVALWKEEDRKFATVIFKKGFVIEFPDMFGGEASEDSEIRKMKEFMAKDPNRYNEKALNKGRQGVGKFFGI